MKYILAVVAIIAEYVVCCIICVAMDWELRNSGVLGYMLLLVIFGVTWRAITGYKKSDTSSDKDIEKND